MTNVEIKRTATRNVVPTPSFTKPSGTYTTTTCNPVVVAAAISVKVGFDVDETNVAKIPTPQFNVTSCFSTTLMGFKITTLPTKGALYLGTVAVTLNQIISKADWSKLEYRLTTETNGNDQAKYKVLTNNGNGVAVESTATNIDFLVSDTPNDDTDPIITTTVVTTTV